MTLMFLRDIPKKLFSPILDAKYRKCEVNKEKNSLGLGK